jgi:glucan 1,3-beta-glucosidase
MNRTVIAVLLGLCVLAGFGRFLWLGREQPIDLPPVASLSCASYAPFRGAETPYDPTFVVSPERVAEDLAALKPLTNCVRTYSTFTGLEVVPAEAAKLGMQVMLGAWIGRDVVQNRRELDRAVDLANAYPDTVRMVIVGNEVLLRREQPEAAIATMLADTKARLPDGVDITYADVWEFWVRAPSLVPLVDVVTLHILPYWEDHPIGIDHAIDHVEAIHDDMVQVFAGKPVLIGETGWPSVGRQRDLPKIALQKLRS